MGEIWGCKVLVTGALKCLSGNWVSLAGCFRPIYLELEVRQLWDKDSAASACSKHYWQLAHVQHRNASTAWPASKQFSENRHKYTSTLPACQLMINLVIGHVFSQKRIYALVLVCWSVCVSTIQPPSYSLKEQFRIVGNAIRKMIPLMSVQWTWSYRQQPVSLI